MRKPFIAAALCGAVAASALTAAPAYATGQEGPLTSIEIEVNGSKISITAPAGGKPTVTTNGETTTPKPSRTPTATATPTPKPSSTAIPTPDTQDDEIAEQQAEQGQSRADEVFAETNRVRTEHGLQPLEKDDCLTAAAGRHADVMITDYRHSTDPEMDRVVKECGLSELSENIATGQESPAEVVDTWLNSVKGHREAMLSPTATHMGTGATDSNTWIQLFTVRGKEDEAEKKDAPPVEMPPAEPVSAPADAAPSGLKAEQGLTPDALNLLRQVHQKWPGLEIGGVRQDSKPDHPSGRALDIMTGGNDCNPVGQEIADWAKANHEQLNVHYLIWCGEIWNTERADEGWRPASGHNDHVHITVNDGKTA